MLAAAVAWLAGRKYGAGGGCPALKTVLLLIDSTHHSPGNVSLCTLLLQIGATDHATEPVAVALLPAKPAQGLTGKGRRLQRTPEKARGRPEDGGEQVTQACRCIALQVLLAYVQYRHDEWPRRAAHDSPLRTKRSNIQYPGLQTVWLLPARARSTVVWAACSIGPKLLTPT